MDSDNKKTDGKKFDVKQRSTRRMQVYIIVICGVCLIGIISCLLLRNQLLNNMQNTGYSIARSVSISYESSDRNNLAIYEAYISYAEEMIDREINNGWTDEQLEDWFEMYFQTLLNTLGEDVVRPYIEYKGKIYSREEWDGWDTYDYANMEWYQAARASDKVIYTDVYADPITDKPIVTVAKKCKGSDTAIALDVFPENFQLQTDMFLLPDKSSLYMCDSQGALIYAQEDLENVSGEDLEWYLSDLTDAAYKHQDDTGRYLTKTPQGQRVCVYSHVMENGWVVVITVAYFSVIANFWVVLALFVAFVIILSYLLYKDYRLNMKNNRNTETAMILANSYLSIYRVNYEEETYEALKPSQYTKENLPMTGNYSDFMDSVETAIAQATRKSFRDSFSCASIKRLRQQNIHNFGGEFQRLFGDTYRWVDARVLFDDDLTENEVILCFKEVEEDKKRQLHEMELIESALESSKRNEKTRLAFFNNMSHDMRTPLNAILGLSELAHEHIDDPEAVSGYLDKIYFSGNTLLNLVNDILDVSRIEAGKAMLDYRQVDLEECINDCVAAFELQADAEKKTFKLNLDIKDKFVYADPSRMNQIFNNILSNSFKFTSAGDTISVDVKQYGEKKYAQYQIVIKDTGIGMSEDFLPRIFEPYARETQFSANQVIGTGLGMPIVKNLITQMSGQITVESKLGKGTTFTITIPFSIVADEEAEKAKEEKEEGRKTKEKKFSLEGKKILLAEDNMLNMEVATEILKMNDVDVVQAWNGLEAVDAFKGSAPFEFDAILMDMQMPQMDGCEAARNIRALVRPDAQSVPIIAVTANAFAEDIAATTAAGMDTHIPKPIDFDLLCKTLEELTKKKK